MKSRYSIGIFIVASVMIAGIMLLYQDSYQRTEKRYLSEQETKLKEETVQTEGTAMSLCIWQIKRQYLSEQVFRCQVFRRNFKKRFERKRKSEI